METKKCRDCGKVKPKESFHKIGDKDYRRPECGDCFNKYRRMLTALNDGVRRYAEMTEEQKEAKRLRGKERRKTYNEKNKHKYRARYILNQAVIRGEVTKKPCEKCGATKVQAHHYKGYAIENALDVQWLCQPHHFIEHRSYKLNPRTGSKSEGVN